MALRIASIIIPVANNKGHMLNDLHKNVEQWLLTAFQGFTAHTVIGQWMHEGVRYEDTSIQYDVHYVVQSEQGGWLRDIAHLVMDNSDQLAVAVVFSGAPEVIAKRKPAKLSKKQRTSLMDALDALRKERAVMQRYLTVARTEVERGTFRAVLQDIAAKEASIAKQVMDSDNA